MNEEERRSWLKARERTARQLEENKNPKLADRLRQELRMIDALIKEYFRPGTPVL